MGTYQPGEFIFHCLIYLPFHTVHGVLKARILKWFAIFFSSYMQSTLFEMQGWMKHKLESGFLGEYITSDSQMTPPLWQKAKWNLEPLDEGEQEA